MAIKTMTLEEIKNLPPLTEERLNEIKNFQNTDFSDCPKQTKEDIKQESKDLLKGLKDESTPKGRDLFDSLDNKSSNHSNENTPRIEKKELPKTSSDKNSPVLPSLAMTAVAGGLALATARKRKKQQM